MVGVNSGIYLCRPYKVCHLLENEALEVMKVDARVSEMAGREDVVTKTILTRCRSAYRAIPSARETVLMWRLTTSGLGSLILILANVVYTGTFDMQSAKLVACNDISREQSKGSV